jgi:hypothetical protein
MAIIQLKYATVSGHVPASLQPGEIALNLADGAIFWPDQNGVVQSYDFNNPVAPTMGGSDNSLFVANTAFVQGLVQGLFATLSGSGVPSTLNTLAKLAAALGGSATFASDTNSALANRLRFDGTQSLTATQQAQAKTNLGIGVSGGRIGIGDVSFTMDNTKTVIGLIAVYTATRTLTLPLATAFPPGSEVVIEDEVGAVSATNNLILQRSSSGSDLINNSASPLTIATQIFSVRLETDGASRWTASIIGVPAAPTVGTIDGGTF